MPHAHGPPPADHHHDDHDHDCQTCGAAPVAGLAACPYCRSAYPGLEAGVSCPACGCVSLKGRTVCADCKAALTRTCVFCNAASILDVPQCTRCYEPFEGAEERKRARMAGGGAVAPNADPTGANIFNTLNSILKR